MARKKRLNVVKISAEYTDGNGDASEHFMEQGEPVHESQELEDDEIHVQQQHDGSMNMSGEDAIGEKRGRTTLTHIWDLPAGNRIVVKCNKLGQPIGAEGGLLGKFLGTVARNGGYCPLNLKDWRMVKKDGGAETMLQFVETKFLYPHLCEKWILKSTGRDWRRYKASLKKTHFNAKKKRSALYKLCPEDVDYDQWVALVKVWKSKEGKALSEKNKNSRAMMKTTHTAGSKSYARWAEDMKQDDPQKKQPHRAMVYLATHKRTAKDKSEHVAELENLMNEQPELVQDDKGRVAWKGDVLHQVLGDEKPGQVHGMGLLPVPNDVYGQTSRRLKNINITTIEGSPSDVGIHVIDEVQKLKEHVQNQDLLIQELLKTKSCHGNNKPAKLFSRKDKPTKENKIKGHHSNYQSQAVHYKRKRVQCNVADLEDSRSEQEYISMNNGRVLDQQNTYEDDDMSFSTEKYDNYANQQLLQCQEAPPSSWSARSFPQQEGTEQQQQKFQNCMNNIQDQVARNRTQHHVPSKKTRPSPMEVGSIVLLLTAKYPNKDQVAYATLLSCNPSTKVGGVELGNQFWKVRINHSLCKTEALVRPLDCCKSIDDAHAKGMPIAWPSICVRKING